MSTIIEVKDLNKSFTVGVQQVPVLKDVSFSVETGGFSIIFGPSGCGKSTLLHTVLGLEEPTSGSVVFLGQNLYSDGFVSEDDRSQFRKEHIGMVYQQPNWIKALTVVENVAFPLSLLGGDKIAGIQKAAQILQSIGMAAWANYKPSELSSGQQQKIALARALITNPEVIIADEPTGNLDFESGQELMKILSDLNSQGKTVIMVTHDLEYLKYAKEALQMFDGSIIKKFADGDKEKLLKTIDIKRGDGDGLMKEAKP